MRIVRAPAELAEAVAAARREAARGFGDDRVFLERYLAPPRHVEIQILGDAHGNVVHLRERECSIQRRHQKIIEESPSPRVDAALRARLTARGRSPRRARSATRARAPSSSSSTTRGEFFFLEVNTRLQVEHPVTEAVTGHRPRARAAARRRGRAARLRAGRRAASRARHRGAALRRGPGQRLPARPAAGCSPAQPPRDRRCAGTRRRARDR